MARLLAVLALALVPVVAFGQQDAAQRHFEDGVAMLQRDDYGGALRAFEEARELHETATVVFNIAGCLRALSRYGEAVMAYEHFLLIGRRREQRTEAERALADLAPQVSRGTVRTSVEGAELFLDGRPVLEQPVAVTVDATAVIEARLRGHHPARVAIRRQSSEPFEVDLRLDPIDTGRVRRHSREDLAPIPPANEPVSPPPDRPARSSSSGPWPILLAGAALVAGGVVLTLVLTQSGTRELPGEPVYTSP